MGCRAYSVGLIMSDIKPLGKMWIIRYETIYPKASYDF